MLPLIRQDTQLLKPDHLNSYFISQTIEEGVYCFQTLAKHQLGSDLYLIQNGTPKLIGYWSKILPLSAMNYSSTELKLLGLCVNSSQCKHLFTEVDLTVQYII